MAFTSVGSLGSANSKVSGASVSLTTIAAAEVGNLVLVACAFDNIGGPDGGDTTNMTVTDSAGNTYTRIREFNNDITPGAGCNVGLFRSIIDTELASGGTITASTASAVTAKAVTAWEFALGTAGVNIVSTNANAGGGDPQPITISGLTSAAYLWVEALAREGPSTDTLTEDADYTGFTPNGTTGGSADGNMTVSAAFRIFTGTTDTYNAGATARTNAQVYCAIAEAGGVSGDATAVHRASLAQRQANLVKRVGAVHAPSVSLTPILGQDSESWYNHADAFYNEDDYYDHTAKTAQRTTGGQPFRPYGSFSGRGVTQGSVTESVVAVHRPTAQRQASLFFSVTRSFVLTLPTRFVGLFSRQRPDSQPGRRYGTFTRTAGSTQISVAVDVGHPTTVQRSSTKLLGLTAVHRVPLIVRLSSAINFTTDLIARHVVSAARLSPGVLSFSVVRVSTATVRRVGQINEGITAIRTATVARLGQLLRRVVSAHFDPTDEGDEVQVSFRVVRPVSVSVIAGHVLSVQRQANLFFSKTAPRLVSVVVDLVASVFTLAFSVVAVHATSLQRQGNLALAVVRKGLTSLQRQANLFFSVIHDHVVTAARRVVRPLSFSVVAVHLASKGMVLQLAAAFSAVVRHAQSLQRQGNLFLRTSVVRDVTASVIATATTTITLAFNLIVKHTASLQRQANIFGAVLRVPVLTLARLITLGAFAVTAVHRVVSSVAVNATAITETVFRSVNVRVSVFFRPSGPKFTGFPGIGLFLGRRKQWTRRK